MGNEYCFEISFPSIDFDSYKTTSEKCLKSHRAHLTVKKDEIKIKIYYKPETLFANKLFLWLMDTNQNDFGRSIKTSIDNFDNQDLYNIDFSKCQILRTSDASNQVELEYRYVTIFVDWVKLHSKSSENSNNTAEFYLNNTAIKIAEPFYTSFYGLGDDFKIARLKERDSFYQLDNSEFRPELHFGYTNKNDSKEIIITKNPKIRFNYKQDIKEVEAIEYAEIVCLFSSFYAHSQIDYSYARIHLNNKTITIHKILPPQIFSNFPQSIFSVDLDSIFKSNWQKLTSENFNKLKKAIEKLNQSFIIDGSSKFLLRYNIIEICKEGDREINEEFKYKVSKKDRAEKYKDALNLLLEIISNDDKDSFKKKWDAARQNDLKYKVMLGPLKIFLKKNNLNIDEFQINVEKIKEMRDSLTHSINNIKSDELEEANNQLYWISVVLIANLMGLSNFISSNKYIKLKS